MWQECEECRTNGTKLIRATERSCCFLRISFGPWRTDCLRTPYNTENYDSRRNLSGLANVRGKCVESYCHGRWLRVYQNLQKNQASPMQDVRTMGVNVNSGRRWYLNPLLPFRKLMSENEQSKTSENYFFYRNNEKTGFKMSEYGLFNKWCWNNRTSTC